MFTVKNCVISGFVAGGIVLTGYCLYRHYKEFEEEEWGGHCAHPDCNIAAAAVRRAVEKRSPSKKSDISLELQMLLLEHQPDSEKREAILRRIANTLVTESIEKAKKAVAEEKNSFQKQVAKNDELMAVSRTLVERVLNFAKGVIQTDKIIKQKFAVSFVAKALVDGAIQSAKATIINENIEKEMYATSLATEALVDEVMKSAETEMVEESTNQAFLIMAKGLVSEAIESAKSALIEENSIEERSYSNTFEKCASTMVEQQYQHVDTEWTTATDSSCSSFDNSQAISDECLYNLWMSSDDYLQSGELESDENLSDYSASTQNTLIKFLHKIQGISNSALEESENETAKALIKKQLRGILPYFSSNNQDELSFDEKIQTEERAFSPCGLHDREILSVSSCEEEKASSTNRNQPVTDDACSFIEVLERLTLFLQTQSRSQEEIKQTREEFKIVWPLLVELNNSSVDIPL